MRSKTKYILLALLLVTLPLIWLWAASRNASAPLSTFEIPDDVPIKAEKGKCYAKCQIPDQYAGEYITFKWEEGERRSHQLGGTHYTATIPTQSATQGYTRTRPRPKTFKLEEASEYFTELKTQRQIPVQIEQRLRPKLITRSTQAGKYGQRQFGKGTRETYPDRMTLRSAKNLSSDVNAAASIPGEGQDWKSFAWQAESGALVKRQYRERSTFPKSAKTFTPPLDQSMLEASSRVLKFRRQQILTHSKYGKKQYLKRLPGASQHVDFVPGTRADSITVRWVGEAQPQAKRYQTYTPPTYKRMRTTRKVKSGARYEWREMLCAHKLTPTFVTRLSAALQQRGYYHEFPSNNFTPALVSALKQFQEKNQLPVGLLDKETLSKLGLWKN